MMDHAQAVQRQAVEKYLLDEMSSAEREEFEEHFFDCQECAADLQATTAFLDEAKKELQRTLPKKPAQRTRGPVWFGFLWQPAFLAAACAVLLAVIAYQNVLVYPRFSGEIARLRRPEVLSVVSLIGANSRDGATPTATVAKGQSILLTLDIPAAEQYASYSCALFGPTGTLVWSVPVSAEQAKDTVSIRIPAGDWQRGDYILLVKAFTNPQHGQSADIARYRFTLQGSD